LTTKEFSDECVTAQVLRHDTLYRHFDNNQGLDPEKFIEYCIFECCKVLGLSLVGWRWYMNKELQLLMIINEGREQGGKPVGEPLHVLGACASEDDPYHPSFHHPTKLLHGGACPRNNTCNTIGCYHSESPGLGPAASRRAAGRPSFNAKTLACS